MVVDLTANVQAVFDAKTLEDKKHAMLELIDRSAAKQATKADARRTVEALRSTTKLDYFAFNYMASGEGMKVQK